MSKNTFKINYPSIHPGTDKSQITFIQGQPDLISVFNPGDDKGPRRFFVTDATVASLDCMKDFIAKFDDDICGRDRLLILGSGEPYKTIESVLNIVSSAVDADFNRKDVFVGIGGGVICDTTAFAASIFKRGAKVQLVPTTLLAMVDASIGGKTGCDFDNYKNIIGSFFPAEKLYYFPEFVQYLPENQYNSGLAEAFKTALLFDTELYNIFKTESEKINARDKEVLDVVIQKCVKAKATIVEKDFTEKNIRAYLNLGHTFGHALESVAGLGIITHGAAVAWGISRSIELSYKKEYCNEAFRNEIFDILKMYNWETAGIPPQIIGGGIGERLLSVMHKDKKNLNSNVRVIIQKSLADPNEKITELTSTVIEEVEDKDILSVLK
ncbi:MAG: 3-dehydroquinate synthase [Treponema sp.]|nr:3-dehydroquinate synthase [Treponema sp.]